MASKGRSPLEEICRGSIISNSAMDGTENKGKVPPKIENWGDMGRSTGERCGCLRNGGCKSGGCVLILEYWLRACMPVPWCSGGALVVL